MSGNSGWRRRGAWLCDLQRVNVCRCDWLPSERWRKCGLRRVRLDQAALKAANHLAGIYIAGFALWHASVALDGDVGAVTVGTARPACIFELFDQPLDGLLFRVAEFDK